MRMNEMPLKAWIRRASRSTGLAGGIGLVEGGAGRTRRRMAARLLLLVLLLVLPVLLAACTSFRTATPIPPSLAKTLGSDIAAAGVLVESGAGGAAPSASADEGAALAEALGRPVMSSPLDASSLELLLQQPDGLAASASGLRELRARLGHRFAAVGWRRVVPVSHSSFWNVVVVIPIPYIWVWFNYPVRMAGESGVPHDEQIMRIVDLERAEIVSETYLLARGKASEKPYSRRQLSAALKKMGWGAKR